MFEETEPEDGRSVVFFFRQCVQNALLTWCEDNTVRIWKEGTNIASDFQVVNSAAEVTSIEKSSPKERRSKRHSLWSTRTRIKALIKKIL